MNYREILHAFCAQGQPTKEAVAQELQGLSRKELLQLLAAETKELLRLVEDLPNQILDSMDQRLATDTASKVVADALLAKLHAGR